MASPSLALPGSLFVGEDERARLVAHLGPAAGWMVPQGILGWSHEVSVVARDALSEQVRRDAKIVMPDEQIPPAKMPLTHQAALKSPLVAISGRLTPKLIDVGIRVHTVGADRVTSSFYYIAEGGGEAPVRVEGDLVAAVGAMLGERADNEAIERVLDGLVDRLLRSLSKDRVVELSLELAAALPRASADGRGTQDVDLEAFEKELARLVGASEKYTPFLHEIASKIVETSERRVAIPLYGDARKVSQGPFELTVGDQTVALGSYDRWLATGPLTEPTGPSARSPAPAANPILEKKPEPQQARGAEVRPEAKSVEAKPAEVKPEAMSAQAKPAEVKPEAKAVEAKPPATKVAEAKVAPKAAEAKPATTDVKPLTAAPRPGSIPPAHEKVPANQSSARSAAAKVDPATETKVEPAAEPKPVVVEAKSEAKPAVEPAVPVADTKPAVDVKPTSTPEPAAGKAAVDGESKAARRSAAPKAIETEPKAARRSVAPKAIEAEPKAARPSSAPKAKAPAAAASGAPKRDEAALARSKEKGTPWVWIVLALLAAAAAAYFLLGRH